MVRSQPDILGIQKVFYESRTMSHQCEVYKNDGRTLKI